MASSNLSTSVAPPHRIVPMRVIVCGVQRTGTMSMRQALYQLGFHDVYHMHNAMSNPETESPQWVRAIKAKYAGEGTFNREDWDKLLGHCQATCDLPVVLFSAELAELYPEAKVVILNREPEAWYESVSHTIGRNRGTVSIGTSASIWYRGALDDGTKAMGKMFGALFGLALGHAPEDKEASLAWFGKMYKEFRDRIPAERRIEYTIKDGWEPLCEHLGVPVPMVRDEGTGDMVVAPFPRINDRAMFNENMAIVRAQAVQRANRNLMDKLGKAALTVVVGYAGYVAWKTRLGGRL